MGEDGLEPQHPEEVLGRGRGLQGVVQDLELNDALPLLLLGGVVSGDLVVEEPSLRWCGCERGRTDEEGREGGREGREERKGRR